MGCSMVDASSVVSKRSDVMLELRPIFAVSNKEELNKLELSERSGQRLGSLIDIKIEKFKI
jgi:hypothetical protein